MAPLLLGPEPDTRGIPPPGHQDDNQLKGDIMADEDKTVYKVVMNIEEQYSIWPADRENAMGWKDAGKTGTKEECMKHIQEVWTDMRPKSLRDAMDKR